MLCEERNLLTSCIIWDVNWVPLSERISLGILVSLNMKIRASATVSVSIFDNTFTLGYQLATSTNVSIYFFLLFVAGFRGPKISKATLWNGVVMISIIYSLVFCKYLFGIVLSQMSQDLLYLETSLTISGQKKCGFILERVFVIPK